jgi:hypothetical protein
LIIKNNGRCSKGNIVNQIETNLNGNDFDEDLFLDLLLDQTKAKISLLLNEVVSQLAYYINLIYKVDGH